MEGYLVWKIKCIGPKGAWWGRPVFPTGVGLWLSFSLFFPTLHLWPRASFLPPSSDSAGAHFFRVTRENRKMAYSKDSELDNLPRRIPLVIPSRAQWKKSHSGAEKTKLVFLEDIQGLYIPSFPPFAPSPPLAFLFCVFALGGGGGVKWAERGRSVKGEGRRGKWKWEVRVTVREGGRKGK